VVIPDGTLSERHELTDIIRPDTTQGRRKPVNSAPVR
jgi:hypothetical protein